jgi:hypothetical protein
MNQLNNQSIELIKTLLRDQAIYDIYQPIRKQEIILGDRLTKINNELINLSIGINSELNPYVDYEERNDISLRYYNKFKDAFNRRYKIMKEFKYTFSKRYDLTKNQYLDIYESFRESIINQTEADLQNEKNQVDIIIKELGGKPIINETNKDESINYIDNKYLR